MPKLILPTTSPTKILKELAKRELENVPLITILERHLRKKNKQLIVFPPHEKKVVLLLSGGLDSIVVWAILLLHYKLEVFPFVVQSKRAGERQSIAYFTHFFKQKRVRKFHEPYISSTPFLANEFSDTILDPTNLSAQEQLQYYNPILKKPVPLGIAGANILSAYQAVYYTIYLKWKKGIAVNTIINGITAEDGLSMASQTLTSIRTLLTHFRTITNNHLLQFFALPFEKELEFFWSRADIVRLGMKLGLPLEKTHSCDLLNVHHCGECSSCLHRRKTFDEVGFLDTTIYQSKLTWLTTLTQFLTRHTLK